MKKFFSKILIAIFMLGIFLSPFAPNYSTENKGFEITGNEINAQVDDKPWWYQASYGFTISIKSFATKQECDTAREAEVKNGGKIDYECNTGGKPNSTVAGTDYSNVTQEYNTTDRACGFHPLSWHVCIVSWSYTLIFKPVAFFARLAAYILDFFIYYSLQSESYTGEFIDKGWAVVRDIANIFFIIALLYVALKTALALNSTDNKRMIGMIVVIALIINFSLFATQIVIDASNILAKVFYANIKSVDSSGAELVAGYGGSKSITVGLVRTFDPQTIFGFNSVNDDLTSNNVGTFFATLVLAILIMGYMIFMFLSVALVFVARVVMLWILMIFSPIAFISLTIPGMKIPAFGWSEWTKQLFDNAFLAPIFVFLLYIIILFGDVIKIVTGNTIDATNTQGALAGTNVAQASGDTFTTYMKVIIPFILIFVLLRAAKKTAIEMSGEMGAAVNNLGKIAGGFAGGALLGGAAALGTKAIGGIANRLGDGSYAERLRDRGVIRDENGNVIGAKKGLGAWVARQQLKTIDYGKSATFDARQTKLGNFVQSKTGLNLASSSAIGLGPQKGGYSGYQDRAVEQAKKDAELYKTSMSNEQVKEFTIARREAFLEKKADEAEKEYRELYKGRKVSDVQIAAIRGQAKEKYKEKAPKIYTNAGQLNEERMTMYKDRIGQTGLLSSLAHSALEGSGMQVNKDNYMTGDIRKAYLKVFKEKKKKQAQEEAANKEEVFNEGFFNIQFEDYMKDKNSDYYKESNNFDVDIAKTINDNRAMKVKAGLGIAAGVATGSIVGGIVGSTLIGTATGVGSGTNMATREIDKSTTDKIIDSMNKESKNAQNLANRIADLNDILKKGKDLKDINDKPYSLFNSDGKLDKDELRKALVELDTDIKLLEKKGLLTDDEKKKLNKMKVNREIMQGLKTAEKELFDLTGKKPNSGGGTPPPATP
jgi:hypothetical protein